MKNNVLISDMFSRICFPPTLRASSLKSEDRKMPLAAHLDALGSTLFDNIKKAKFLRNKNKIFPFMRFAY